MEQQYLIAVFKSRTQVMRFSQLLRSYGVSNEVISTPREAGSGCGLCVKFEESGFGKVLNVLSSENFTAYTGIFHVKESGWKRTVRAY